MLFNSYIFVFLFLPLCLVGFYILQNKQATLAKVWLTCFSLWFYGYFNQYYLLIMICSIIGNYFIHCLIVRARNKEFKIEQERSICQSKEFNAKQASLNVGSKQIMLTGVVLNLLVLFYFKYFDFFIDNINSLFGSSIPLKNILLPLGISFFTFQQISFLVDTYRGELSRYTGAFSEAMTGNEIMGAEKPISFIDYALFVSFSRS